MITQLKYVSNLHTTRKGAINCFPKIKYLSHHLQCDQTPHNIMTSTNGKKRKSKSTREVTLTKIKNKIANIYIYLNIFK